MTDFVSFIQSVLLLFKDRDLKINFFFNPKIMIWACVFSSLRICQISPPFKLKNILGCVQRWFPPHPPHPPPFLLAFLRTVFCWMYLSLQQLFHAWPVFAPILLSSDEVSAHFGSCHPDSNWSCFGSSERGEWVKELCHLGREARHTHLNHSLHGLISLLQGALSQSWAVELLREL